MGMCRAATQTSDLAMAKVVIRQYRIACESEVCFARAGTNKYPPFRPSHSHLPLYFSRRSSYATNASNRYSKHQHLLASTMSTPPASEGEGKPAITFTEKEESVLKVAWFCLKSAPPEVDLAKLTKAAGFNTTKTATNTWGIIKKKLAQMSPQATSGEDASESTMPATPKTPKSKATPKAKAIPMKRGKNEGSDGDDEGTGVEGMETPRKKQRKTPVKKTLKTIKSEAMATDNDNGEKDMDGEVDA
nr:hypothetical protein CFP56_59618 [Quercus suber]